MPLYDRICDNDHKQIDLFEKMDTPDPTCPECGQPTRRAFLTKGNAVVGDDIPGGIYIKHGICNPDGTPKRYDTKADIKRAADRAGLTQAPQWKEGDKHLKRWI